MMKIFSLRIVVFKFLILISSVGWTADETISAETLENEKHELYFAIRSKDLNEVQLQYSNFIKQGNPLSWGFLDWPNPLLAAFESSSAGVVDFLLSLPVANEWLKEKNERGETTIHAAIRGVDVSTLKKVISFPKMEELLNSKDAFGRWPFRLAVDLGKVETVRYLINFPQVRAQLAMRDEHEVTILHSAVKSGNIEIVKTLFGLPVSRSLILDQDENGETVLHHAVGPGVPNEILIFLLNQPEALELFSLVSYSGNTALHLARPKSFLLIARFLQNEPQYLQLIKSRNEREETSLHGLFERHREINLTEFFRLKNFEDLLLEKDFAGRNPMHVAVDKGSVNIFIQVAKLAKKPKKLFEEPNNEGTSPMGLAVKMGRVEIVGALIAEGFDFENVLINHKRVSAIEYILQNSSDEDFWMRIKLLEFLLCRPAEESQSSGWSVIQ